MAHLIVSMNFRLGDERRFFLDHFLISGSSNFFFLSFPQFASKGIFHLGASNHSDLRSYLFDFVWNDYSFCMSDHSDCAEPIIVVVL